MQPGDLCRVRMGHNLAPVVILIGDSHYRWTSLVPQVKTEWNDLIFIVSVFAGRKYVWGMDDMSSDTEDVYFALTTSGVGWNARYTRSDEEDDKLALVQPG